MQFRFLRIVYKFNYFYSVIIISSLFIFIYGSLLGNKLSIDPGFKEAKSIVNDNNICIGGLENLSCQINLIYSFKNKNKNILFFGNSQTGAINNFREGDMNYISIINEALLLKKKNLEIKSIWLPNANLNEFERIYDGFTTCNLVIDLLIIPLFLDDTRDDSIREDLKDYSNNLCYQDSNIIKEERKNIGNLKRLNSYLEDRLSFFNYLESINSKLKIDIYKLRNLIFNIKASTKRSIKKSSYYSNISALENILLKRENNNLQTIIYIPPLLDANNSEIIPYYSIEYENFKSKIIEICENNKFCYFQNLENSVSKDFWGYKKSTKLLATDNQEIDYMHFTGKGHKQFAEELLKILLSKTSYLN